MCLTLSICSPWGIISTVPARALNSPPPLSKNFLFFLDYSIYFGLRFDHKYYSSFVHPLGSESSSFADTHCSSWCDF